MQNMGNSCNGKIENKEIKKIYKKIGKYTVNYYSCTGISQISL